MKRFVVAAALCAYSFSAEAQTQTSYVHVAVDAVMPDGGSRIAITGPLAGETVSVERTFGGFNAASAEACHRMALVAMAKPGQYHLEVRVAGSGFGVTTCKLVRAVP